MVSDESWNPDENEVEDIIEELPTLLAVKRFAATLDRISWFKRVGEPLSPEERRLAAAYADSLGFPHTDVAPVPDWEVALDCASTHDRDTEAWEAEEQMRVAMNADLLTRVREEALMVVLTHVSDLAGQALRAHMEDLAALWDIDDQEFLNAAAGAAVQASHQMALAIATEADADHPFRHKFHLFEAGRWPIGIVGSSFNLF